MDFSLETEEILDPTLSLCVYAMSIFNLLHVCHSTYRWDGLVPPLV